MTASEDTSAVQVVEDGPDRRRVFVAGRWYSMAIVGRNRAVWMCGLPRTIEAAAFEDLATVLIHVAAEMRGAGPVEATASGLRVRAQE